MVKEGEVGTDIVGTHPIFAEERVVISILSLSTLQLDQFYYIGNDFVSLFCRLSILMYPHPVNLIGRLY